MKSKLEFLKEKIEELERLFIGLFSAKFGALPLCNSSIQRTKLKETYRKNRNDKIIEQIERIIKKVSNLQN